MDLLEHPRSLGLALAVCAGLALGPAIPAVAGDEGPFADGGRRFHVANLGSDAGSCGRRSSPCRTITRAMSLARDGDTVLVGPGIYGDLNHDLDLSDPGEEGTPESEPCVICVRKRLAIHAAEGPLVTVINGVLRPSVVTIFADGVTFGGIDKGFTFGSVFDTALRVEGAADVRVTGNVLSGNILGMFVRAERGPIHVIANYVAQARSAIQLDSRSPGYVILRRNIIVGCSNFGIQVAGDAPAVITDNSVTGCFGNGLVLGNDSRVSRNVFVANGVGVRVGALSSSGFDAPGIRLQDNLIASNQSVGILIVPSGAAPDHRVHRNDIYANGVAATEDPGAGIRIPANCGLVNGSGSDVKATNNFWGSSKGPGADPADNAGPGSGCDVAAGVTKVVPFASSPLTSGGF
jgi:hypothetical protein